MAPSLPDGPKEGESKCRTNHGCEKISTSRQWLEGTGGLRTESYPAIADRGNSDTSQTRHRYDEANAEGPSRQRPQARALRQDRRPARTCGGDTLRGGATRN